MNAKLKEQNELKMHKECPRGSNVLCDQRNGALDARQGDQELTLGRKKWSRLLF